MISSITTFNPNTPEEAERSVLSWVLNDREGVAIPSLTEKGLRTEHFASTRHQLVYQAAQELTSSGVRPDLINLPNKLSQMGVLDVVGGEYLVSLLDAFLYAGDSQSHVDVVISAYTKRELGRVSTVLKQGELDPTSDPEETIRKATELLHSLALSKSSSKPVSFAEALAAERHNVHYLRDNPHVCSPLVPTGFRDLDAALGGGLERGTLCLIGARPSKGKTALSLRFMDNQIQQGYPVMFFSYEMTTSALVQRLMSTRMSTPDKKVPSRAIKVARGLQENQVQMIDRWVASVEADTYSSEHFLRIVDDPLLPMAVLKAQARAYHQECQRQGMPGLAAIYVDYTDRLPDVRKCKGNSAERSIAIGEAALSLAELGKELNCVMSLLCQIGRQVEGRADKRPTCSDLGGSTHLENHAQTALLIHDPFDPKDPQSIGEPFEIVIDKSRDGAKSVVKMLRDRSCGEFSDIAQVAAPYVPY